VTQEQFPDHESEIKQTQVDGCAEREQGDWACGDWVWPSGAVDALTRCMQSWGNHATHVKEIAYDDGSLPPALNVAVSARLPNISTAVALSDSVLRRIVEILEEEREESAEAVGDWLQANMCGAGAAESGSEGGCNYEDEEELEHKHKKKTKKKKKKKKKRKEGEHVVELGGEQEEGGGEHQGDATQESDHDQEEEEVMVSQKESTPDGAAPADAAAEAPKCNQKKAKKAKKAEEAEEPVVVAAPDAVAPVAAADAEATKPKVIPPPPTCA